MPRPALCLSPRPPPPQSWIQPSTWDDKACPSKVIPVNDLTAILESLVRLIPADFVLSAVRSSASPVGVLSVGLARGLRAVGPAVRGPGGGLYVRVTGNSEGWHDPKFGVLGQGYNVFAGEAGRLPRGWPACACAWRGWACPQAWPRREPAKQASGSGCAATGCAAGPPARLPSRPCATHSPLAPVPPTPPLHPRTTTTHAHLQASRFPLASPQLTPASHIRTSSP